MPSRYGDEARRRGVYRELNDQLARLDSNFNNSKRRAVIRLTLGCECSNRACVRVIPIMLSDYECVRAYPRRSVIAPNHEDPEVEVVIAEDRFYAIVETLAGTASRIAIDTDPRRRPTLKNAGPSSLQPPDGTPDNGAQWTG